MKPKTPKKPPVPKVGKPLPTTPIWIRCRATEGCDGNQATLTMRTKTPGGGSITRYRCSSCNKPFMIQI